MAENNGNGAITPFHYTYESGISSDGQLVRIKRKHPTLVEMHPQQLDIPLVVLLSSVAQLLATLAGAEIKEQIPGNGGGSSSSGGRIIHGG